MSDYDLFCHRNGFYLMVNWIELNRRRISDKSWNQIENSMKRNEETYGRNLREAPLNKCAFGEAKATDGYFEKYGPASFSYEHRIC